MSWWWLLPPPLPTCVWFGGSRVGYVGRLVRGDKEKLFLNLYRQDIKSNKYLKKAWRTQNGLHQHFEHLDRSVNKNMMDKNQNDTVRPTRLYPLPFFPSPHWHVAPVPLAGPAELLWEQPGHVAWVPGTHAVGPHLLLTMVRQVHLAYMLTKDGEGGAERHETNNTTVDHRQVDHFGTWDYM